MLALAPDVAENHLALGTLWLHQERFAATAEAFGRALALDPGDAEAAAGLARAQAEDVASSEAEA